MNYIDRLRNLYNALWANKKQIITALIIMFVLLLLKTILFLKSIPKDIDMVISAYELYIHPDGEYGVLGRLSWVFPIIPIFIFVIICLTNSLYSKYVVIRYEDRKNIWREHALYIVMVSFIFALLILICGYILGGLLTGNFRNNWTSSNSYVYKNFNKIMDLSLIPKYFFGYKLILISFIGSMLGLCTYGFLMCILKMYLKNMYVYVIMITLVLFETLGPKISIVLAQVLLNIKLLANPKVLIINYTYLLGINLILYLIGYYLVDYKDFI